MLTLDLRINGKCIAVADISNISDLADISNYRVNAWESANPLTGEPAKSTNFSIVEHERNNSVWLLVKKVVDQIVLQSE